MQIAMCHCYKSLKKQYLDGAFSCCPLQVLNDACAESCTTPRLVFGTKIEKLNSNFLETQCPKMTKNSVRNAPKPRFSPLLRTQFKFATTQFFRKLKRVDSVANVRTKKQA